ncbi:MAG: TIGR03619 family F420-dependent LLM class oxidoreductase [Actinomycetia bacterium]|nr:TIGR03619 family F420-dependent LLM class oxidoreductase [Actinomycetes bacterium]
MAATPALGLGLPVSGAWATPENMRHVAVRAEELGYASLWSFQRLLHPVDEDWGAVYHGVIDPVSALAYVAACTSGIRLGTAVVNLPFYSPIVLSKALTTVDIVSKGRLDVGLGLGWAAAEFEAVGVPMEKRGARAAEFIECLTAIWTQPEVEYHGQFYDVPLSRVEPKPVQQPHPPLLMGGTADAALRRIGRIADGWISSSRTDLTTIGQSIDVVRSAASEAGRNTGALRFVTRGVVRLGGEAPADRVPLQGSADQIRSDLQALAAAGVTEVFLDLNWDPETVAQDVSAAAALDNAERVMTELAPG